MGKKITKKQIVQELMDLKSVEMWKIRKKIERLTLKFHKLVRHQIDKKTSEYACTNCNHKHTDLTVKLKTNKKCLNCGHKFEVIGKHNKIDSIRDYITLYENNNRNELVCRVFWFEMVHKKDKCTFKISQLTEVLRLNVDRDVSIKKDTYYVSGCGFRHYDGYKDWKQEKSNYSSLRQYLITDVVYTKGLKNVIKKTKYKYSAMDIVAKHSRIDTLHYLDFWYMHPKVELLTKAKCFNLIQDLMNYRGSMSEIERWIKIDKEIMKIIIKHNLNYDQSKMAIRYKLRQLKYIKLAVRYRLDVDSRMMKRVSKILDYLDEQKMHCSFYTDYLSMAEDLGMNMRDKTILYPINLSEAHDDVMVKYKDVKDIIITEKIQAYADELKVYVYEDKGLLIRPAVSQTELINESKMLNHCVRKYAKNMSKRKTAIFFIRDIKNPNNPFVTLELKDKNVVQVRARKNEEPPINVKNFVRSWENKFGFVGW